MAGASRDAGACRRAARSAAACRRGSKETLSGPSERLVADAMRLIGLGAQAPVPVSLVIGVIPLEPHDLAVALEGQHVGRDAVEKPAIVRDNDGEARVFKERLLER